MQDHQPSIQEWQSLYGAAIDFWRIQPWQWVNDTDLFGVKNPEDGQIGYCCVVGALREFLGLVVYLGTEGLESYLKIQTSESPEEDVLSTGKCLTASFGDRKSLQKPDLGVIKELGLRFRGPKSWPLFRSYEPGYYPWYINQRQVRFLAHAFRQAADVSLRIKHNRNLLSNSEEGRFLVRVRSRAGRTFTGRMNGYRPFLRKKQKGRCRSRTSFVCSVSRKGESDRQVSGRLISAMSRCP